MHATDILDRIADLASSGNRKDSYLASALALIIVVRLLYSIHFGKEE